MGYEVTNSQMFGFKFEGFGEDLDRYSMNEEDDFEDEELEDEEDRDEEDENDENQRYKKLLAYCNNLGLDIGISYDDQGGYFEDLVVGINLSTSTLYEINNANATIQQVITKEVLEEISNIIDCKPASNIPAVHVNYYLAW